MLISTKGRYALRVMIDLAEHQTDGFIPLKMIAERQEISEKYLESIIKLLVKAKLLNGLRGKIIFANGFELLAGEKMELIFKLVSSINLEPVEESSWNRRLNVHISQDNGLKTLLQSIDSTLRVTVAKAKSRELGFITLFTDGSGNYWFKVSRGFSTALNESLSSLETLIDEIKTSETLVISENEEEKLNSLYRLLTELYS